MNYERFMASLYKLLLAGVVVFAGYCLWQLWDLHKEHARLLGVESNLRARLADKQREIRENQRKLERLRTDPAYVDMVIRRRLGYAKPSELIFRFEQQDDSSRSIPAANDR